MMRYYLNVQFQGQRFNLSSWEVSLKEILCQTGKTEGNKYMWFLFYVPLSFLFFLTHIANILHFLIYAY